MTDYEWDALETRAQKMVNVTDKETKELMVLKELWDKYKKKRKMKEPNNLSFMLEFCNADKK